MKQVPNQPLVNVGIVLVGSELLDGRIADRHTQWLAHQLGVLHAVVVEAAVISDDSAMLLLTLRRMAEHCGLIVCCGGLGPTQDDITRGVFGTLWQCHIEYDAEPPAGFVFLPNDVGTAYGLYGVRDGVHYLVLPGPPSELRPMVQRYAMSYLQKAITVRQGDESLVLTIFFVPESVLDRQVQELQRQHPTYIRGWATRMGEWSTELVIYLVSRQNASDIVSALRAHFGNHCIYEGTVALGREALSLLSQRNAQLISIESCTGGMFAQSLTEHDGASQHFAAGVIPYTVQAKITLGVQPTTINRYGTVSTQVAEELVQAAHARYGNAPDSTSAMRLYVAITGVCGPTPSETGVAVGNAIIALGVEDCKTSKLTIHSRHIAITKPRPRRRMQQLMAIRMFETLFECLYQH